MPSPGPAKLSREGRMRVPNKSRGRNKGKSKSRNRNRQQKQVGAKSKPNGPGSDPEVSANPEEKPKKTRKLYRKTKVLRRWVLPAVFLVPLAIVGLEYYIGQLIGLEHVKVAYREQLVDPWDLLIQKLDAPEVEETSCLGSSASRLTLANIAYTPRKKCPEGQRRMMNVHNPHPDIVDDDTELIPKIVHQHSNTRCLTMRLDRTAVKWAFPKWSYYIHDEESRDRLFTRYCEDFTQSCEFPLLCRIVSKCFDTRHRNRVRHHYLKIELWKFLTLWIFGGVYVELGFLPSTFHPGTIQKRDDGLLLIDPDTGRLSSKMMAVSPRHPIMYYAVQSLLLAMLMEDSPPPSSSSFSALPEGTAAGDEPGAIVLNHAFRLFRDHHHQEPTVGGDDGGGDGRLASRTYRGFWNRTVRVVEGAGLAFHKGESEHARNDWVVSVFASQQDRDTEYRKIGMREVGNGEGDTQGDDDGASSPCLGELYHHL